MQADAADDEKEKPPPPPQPAINLAGHNVHIIQSTMSSLQELSALEVGLLAFEHHKQAKDRAAYIKREFDKRFPPIDKQNTSGVYHCFVGKSFAVCLSHDTRHFIHFKIAQDHIVMFKSRDSPKPIAI
ncbi:hypothetical protein CBR_g52000 [Chara braunii]|uniref:Dynein light chain n=1 Tax=Chara braunii TaxID=69332 RepID=A0A388K6P1_CHABU|nr:hypothetical protein CBR_g52000 [Chara braunii]|eukprot:GBG65699.1 hypothetical protein CBR_g52000 [Chara braunii]